MRHERGVFVLIKLLTFMLLSNQKQPLHPVMSSIKKERAPAGMLGLNACLTSRGLQLLAVSIIQQSLT